MKNKTVKGIIALAVVTALSFAVIIGSNQLSKNMTAGTQGETAEITEELDVSGTEQIDKAAKTESGYVVTVREKGYGGDIVMNVSFDETAASVTKLEITEQNETEGLGSKITEEAFLEQFNGISAPVTLPGTDAGNSSAENSSDNSAILDALDQAKLSDGTFTAKGEPDSNGFTEEVTLTVKDGKITEVNWDGITEDGTKKSVMSENGEYVMTEDGPTCLMILSCGNRESASGICASRSWKFRMGLNRVSPDFVYSGSETERSRSLSSIRQRRARMVWICSCPSRRRQMQSAIIFCGDMKKKNCITAIRFTGMWKICEMARRERSRNGSGRLSKGRSILCA